MSKGYYTKVPRRNHFTIYFAQTGRKLWLNQLKCSLFLPFPNDFRNRKQRQVVPAGARFLRYNGIDMRGPMDFTCGIPVSQVLPDDGRMAAGTLPESMVSWLLAPESDPAYYLPDLHRQVFTLSEIRAFEAVGRLPGEDWGTHLPASLANYVEAQVWNHVPLLAYTDKVRSLSPFAPTIY